MKLTEQNFSVHNALHSLRITQLSLRRALRTNLCPQNLIIIYYGQHSDDDDRGELSKELFSRALFSTE